MSPNNPAWFNPLAHGLGIHLMGAPGAVGTNSEGSSLTSLSNSKSWYSNFNLINARMMLTDHFIPSGSGDNFVGYL